MKSAGGDGDGGCGKNLGVGALESDSSPVNLAPRVSESNETHSWQ